jgi:protein-S-isoprenylcysteine O-methyltransferase Ste14
MKKLSFSKEFWYSLPVAVFLLAGIVVSVQFRTESHPWAVAGGWLLIALGMLLDLIVRQTLTVKANFPNLLSTKRLMIVDGHTLITDGIFGLVRHPLYLGRIIAHFGFSLSFGSLWGAVLMAITATYFLLRIRAEEEMLIEEFGDAYHEYRKHTKQLIPFIY